MAWFRRNRGAGGSGGGAEPVGPAPAPEAVAEPASEAGPETDAQPGGADEAPALAAAPAWTTAAPLPSVVPTIQRVLDRVDARRGTALGRPAPLSLAPLGHAVTPDAPAGAVQAVAVADAPEAGPPSFADQPPLEYVQRAPEGPRAVGPAPPAQLLVPAYQPSRLPSVPVAAPEVQRAPAASSLTTAPAPPAPPVVLPVGEILAPPPPAPPAPMPAAAVELPLAPVQRHADHPGHVDGEAAPTAPDVQRAAADTAPAPPLPDAPLSSATPLGPDATTPPPADVPGSPAADADLPLAPLQRHADHPGHVDGDAAPTAPDVQRAAADTAPAPTPPLPDAPLSSATHLGPPPTPEAPPPAGPDIQRAAADDLPLAPLQRHADHPGHVDGDEGGDGAAPTAPDVQRAATDTAPTPPLLDAPLSSATHLGPPLTPEATTPPAAPDVQRAAAADLPLAPLHRHADHPGHVDGDDATTPAAPTTTDVQRAATDTAPTPPLPAAPLVGDAAPLVAPPSPPAADIAAPPPPAPELPLPGAVQRSAAPRRPVGLGRPLSALPSSIDPAPVQPAASAPAEPMASAPLVGETTSPVPPPLAARVEGDDQVADADHAADAAGPPLDLVQRAAVDAVAPLVGAVPLGPVAPGTGAATNTGPDGPDEAAPPAPRPDLELVQRAPLADTPASTSTSGGPASSTTSAATPATATSPAPPLVVAPLLGGRPFSTQVQRAAEADATAPAGVVDRTGAEALSPAPGRSYQPLAGIGVWNGAPPPDLVGPAIEAPPSHVAAAVQRATGADVSNVRIRRDTGPVAQRLAARAFTSEGEVHIPAAVGSLASGEGASLATHELVHAGQQSALGLTRPLEHTPEGRALEAQARSAEHASLAGLELPRLPLAPPAAPAVQRAPAETTSPSPFSPQQLSRLLDLADHPPMPGIDVQRLIGSHRGPEPAAPAPAPPTEVAEAPPAPPPAKEQTPQELEELATKLFPSLRNLLRSELLSFRRRSGTSSDRPLI